MSKGSKRRPCKDNSYELNYNNINWCKRKQMPKPTNIMRDKKKYNRKDKSWKEEE